MIRQPEQPPPVVVVPYMDDEHSKWELRLLKIATWGSGLALALILTPIVAAIMICGVLVVLA